MSVGQAPAHGTARMSTSPTQTSGAWYVAQTKPRQEERARDNLENQGIRCVLPLLQVEKVRRRTRQWVDEPLFARYLFIELGGENAKWSVLRSTRGVSQLVQFGGVPAKVPYEWMNAFLSRGRVGVPLFDAGQRVVVTEGPFKDIEGIYQQRDGESRAMVLLELLGKRCAGKFPLEALRRVA